MCHPLYVNGAISFVTDSGPSISNGFLFLRYLVQLFKFLLTCCVDIPQSVLDVFNCVIMSFVEIVVGSCVLFIGLNRDNQAISCWYLFVRDNFFAPSHFVVAALFVNLGWQDVQQTRRRLLRISCLRCGGGGDRQVMRACIGRLLWQQGRDSDSGHASHAAPVLRFHLGHCKVLRRQCFLSFGFRLSRLLIDGISRVSGSSECLDGWQGKELFVMMMSLLLVTTLCKGWAARRCWCPLRDQVLDLYSWHSRWGVH